MGTKGLWQKIEESSPVKLIKSAHELIIIVVFYAAVFGIQLSKPSLEVVYSVEKLDPPVSLAALVEDQGKEVDANIVLDRVSQLVGSRNLLVVEINNYSSNRVEDFELKVFGVIKVADVSFSSTSAKLYAERVAAASFSLDSRGLFTLPKLHTLPPNSSTRVLIWGHFLPRYVGNSVEASGAIEGISVRERGEASGFGLFLANNIGSLTLILIVYLVAVSSLRYRRRRGEAVGA